MSSETGEKKKGDISFLARFLTTMQYHSSSDNYFSLKESKTCNTSLQYLDSALVQMQNYCTVGTNTAKNIFL